MLPQIELDDVRFQQLVSEARTRIVHHSPEWTDHNVSDPGITLIESFAWLTEVLSYRIGRIPERLHFALLGLVGITPTSPQCATVPMAFMVSHPGSGGLVPAGTELASPRTAGSDEVVFQTISELTIPRSCRLAAYGIQREADVRLDAVTGGVARPAGELQTPFQDPATEGDGLLLGFASELAGWVIRLEIEFSRAADADDASEDASLVWEASQAQGGWASVGVVADQTKGFSRGSGAITLALPETAGAAEIAGARHHWLRCRIDRRDRPGSRTAVACAAQLFAISAAVAGGTTVGRHAATVTEEPVGTSDGIAGAVYPLQRRPVLTLQVGETLEVREPADAEWVPWRCVDSFEHSTHEDRHFLLDARRGEIRFGPAIRQPDGGWRRYGAIPRAGSLLRMSRYRHGGGSAGNVAPWALSVLPRPVPGIAAGTNPTAARGGVDAEELPDGIERARLAVRARTRAVTREDFERLTLSASSRVARAVCVEPDGAGPVRVHVLPRTEPADRLLEADELIPDAELMALLASELDQHRLLGTSVRLLPVRLRAVSIVADVKTSPRSDTERVQHDVAHALYVFLNPLIGGSATGPADGWPLGRALNQGELFGIVYGIPGVEFVNILRMYETDLRTGGQALQATDSRLVLAPDELIASGKHIVKAVHRD
jgi:predicted phage baseplate assembly protein